MNILGLGICYVAASAALFVYGIWSHKNALRTYGFAIALNVVPLIPFGFLGSEICRLGRVPIAYVPMIAAMMSVLMISRLRVLREDIPLLAGYLVLLPYLLVQSLAQISHYASFLQYYQMWVINIYSMLAVSWIVARIPRPVILTMLRNCIFLIAGCALVGIMKNLTGLTDDTNFMPMQNRNTAVMLLIFATPLALMIRDLNRMHTRSCLLVLLVFSVCVLLMRSRVGLFGFIFAFMAYFTVRFAAGAFGRHRAKLRLSYLVTFVGVISLLFVVLLASPLGTEMAARAANTPESIRVLLGAEDLDRGEPDYLRVQLIRAGIYVAKKHFVWGTGVGLENYREALRGYGLEQETKPHNFYISCLGEFGIIGFTLLMLLLLTIFWRFGGATGEARVAPDVPLITYGFRSVFITLLFVSTMNDYISLPLLWAIFGVGLGLTADSRAERNGPTGPVEAVGYGEF